KGFLKSRTGTSGSARPSNQLSGHAFHALKAARSISCSRGRGEKKERRAARRRSISARLGHFNAFLRARGRAGGKREQRGKDRFHYVRRSPRYAKLPPKNTEDGTLRGASSGIAPRAPHYCSVGGTSTGFGEYVSIHCSRVSCAGAS